MEASKTHFRFPVFCVSADAATLLAAALERGFARIFAACDATLADVVSDFAIMCLVVPPFRNKNYRKKRRKERKINMWYAGILPNTIYGGKMTLTGTTV